MNITNLQHIGALFLFGIFIRPDRWGWIGALVLILAIEIDQAMTWSIPNYWDWFKRVDTILDIIGGCIGFILFRIIIKAVRRQWLIYLERYWKK